MGKKSGSSPPPPAHLAEIVAAKQALDPIGAFLALADEIQGFAHRVCFQPMDVIHFGQAFDAFQRRLSTPGAFRGWKQRCKPLGAACERFLTAATSWRSSPGQRKNVAAARRIEANANEYGTIFDEWQQAYKDLADLREDERARELRRDDEKQSRQATASETTEKAATNDSPLLPEYLTAQDIARHLGKKKGPTESALKRLREKFPDCFRETEGGRKNEAKYLYRADSVIPILSKKTTVERRSNDD